MKIESIRRRTAILLVLGVASIFVLGASILPGAYAKKQFTNKSIESRGGGAYTHKQFTNKSIEGTWGFSGSGTTNGTPAVFVGLDLFDGNGGCSVKNVLNTPSGLVNLTSITCTYKVNPDGTGTATVTFPPPLGLSTFSFVIVSKRNEILAISTDQNIIASFVAKRQ